MDRLSAAQRVTLTWSKETLGLLQDHRSWHILTSLSCIMQFVPSYWGRMFSHEYSLRWSLTELRCITVYSHPSVSLCKSNTNTLIETFMVTWFKFAWVPLTYTSCPVWETSAWNESGPHQVYIQDLARAREVSGSNLGESLFWLRYLVIQFNPLTLWRRSSSKCYLRIQSVPQREHHTSPLQRSTG
jgi:hypothetical protein